MDSVGYRLREERGRLELSQTELGEIAGIAKNTQMLYESDKRSPKADYLSAVAEAGVDVQYVITGERRTDGDSSGLIDAGFLAEIADQLDRIIREAGKKAPTGPDYVRMVAEVYNFLAQEGTRDSETTGRLLKLVVNR